MELCIQHPMMGRHIAARVTSSFPGMRVSIHSQVDRDPPRSRHITALVANTVPAGMLERCPQLQWLHLTSGGTDQLSGDGIPAGLRISHSGCVPARAVAEFVWMALLALSKQGPRLWDQHRLRMWQPTDARLIAGTRLLLIGLGHIGREVARRAGGFDVRVTAVTRTGRPSPLVNEVVAVERIHEAAKGAHHLVVCAPATPETRSLVDADVLGALVPGATVVNVARASLVDTDALVGALQCGQVAGAVLDVHEDEPLDILDPHWSIDNLWVTPHTAFRFPDEERCIAELVVQNLTRLRGGGRLRNEVPVSHRPAGVLTPRRDPAGSRP